MPAAVDPLGLAVDLSDAGLRRRAVELLAEPHADRLRAKAARLRARAARAPVRSNQRRKLTLRADSFEAAAEGIVEKARVA